MFKVVFLDQFAQEHEVLEAEVYLGALVSLWSTLCAEMERGCRVEYADERGGFYVVSASRTVVHWYGIKDNQESFYKEEICGL
jgi:hypothetical protein